MESILYLVHRIPYPPNKGDKIRSYNTLKFLSQNFRVHLGAFIDDPGDAKYKEDLEKLCASVCLLSLDSRRAKLKSISGLFMNKALTLPYYFNEKMQAWVDETIATHQIKKGLVFSSSMAQYIEGERYKALLRLVDFVDVDSDKWSQYVPTASVLMKPVYKYEAIMLQRWEKHVAAEFDQSYFVSGSEASLFKRIAPDVADKISFFNNGVDVEFFSPEHQLENPYKPGRRNIVFTGAMDYWANADAVTWFTQNVFPLLQDVFESISFYIVGSNPSDKVKALDAVDGVHVTGAVKDIRPYMAYASVAVAPMRIARGVQNKVLEAMAMERATVVSPQGYEGIDAQPGKELLIADTVDEWINGIGRVLQEDGFATQLGREGRHHVTENYSWNANLARLVSTMQ